MKVDDINSKKNNWIHVIVSKEINFIEKKIKVWKVLLVFYIHRSLDWVEIPIFFLWRFLLIIEAIKILQKRRWNLSCLCFFFLYIRRFTPTCLQGNSVLKRKNFYRMFLFNSIPFGYSFLLNTVIPKIPRIPRSMQRMKISRFLMRILRFSHVALNEVLGILRVM